MPTSTAIARRPGLERAGAASMVGPEIGSIGGGGFTGWAGWTEEVPELRWPMSTIVYDRMRRSDAHVASVYRALTLPIRQATWRIDGDGCDPRVVAFVEAELGLQDRGRQRRHRQGISFDETLRLALLFLVYGHMAFEQVYDIGEPPPGIAGLPPLVAHLRKLSPRMPRTLTGIDVAADGGLVGIRQWVNRVPGAPAPAGQGYSGGAGFHEVQIPVDRLLYFVNEKEGADWTGTSIFRPAYKHWLIKDQLLRLGPITIERNGMGLPIVHVGEEGDRATALAMAQAARAGEYAGIAEPDGYTFRLEGVKGTIKDEMPLLGYHDQEIARNALAMVLDLGHDRGAQALGSTFVDFLLLAELGLAGQVAETFTEYAIADLVRLNFGPDEAYPPLVMDELHAQDPPTAQAVATMVQWGVITPDASTEQYMRQRYGLPGLPSIGGEGGTLPGPQPAALPPAPNRFQPGVNPGPTSESDPTGTRSLPADFLSAPTGPTFVELAERLRRAQGRMAARNRAAA